MRIEPKYFVVFSSSKLAAVAVGRGRFGVGLLQLRVVSNWIFFVILGSSCCSGTSSGETVS